MTERAGRVSSAPVQLVGRHHQSCDDLIARDGVSDFAHIIKHDVTIKDVIGLHQNRDTSGALVETAGTANARLHLSKPARFYFFF